jgi:hypothetical protein
MRVRVAAARRATHAEEDPSTAAEGVVTVWRASSELTDALREGACFAVTALKPCRGGGGWDGNAPAVASFSGRPVVFVQSTNLTTWRPLPAQQWCGAPQRLRQPHAVADVGELRPGVEVDAVALLVHVGAPCAAARGQTCQVRTFLTHLSLLDFHCPDDLHVSAEKLDTSSERRSGQRVLKRLAGMTGTAWHFTGERSRRQPHLTITIAE